MSEPMLYGETVQELTYLRGKYEQFIIDRERERITKLLEDNCECEEMKEYGYRQCAPHYAVELIKGEK